MEAFRSSRPSEFYLLIAGGTALFGYLFLAFGFGFGDAQPGVALQRAIFIAACCLLMFDVVESTWIGRLARPGFGNPHFWIHAFYLGYFWSALMLLLMWNGQTDHSLTVLIWGLGGIAVGLFMSYRGKLYPPPQIGRFDTDRPVTDRPAGSLYYIWPIIVVAMFAALILMPPDQGWPQEYLLFQMIFLGSIMPLYRHATPHYWYNIYPRFLGLALLMAGLLLF